MLAVTRYRVPDHDAVSFAERARTALAALAARPGHVWGGVGRSTDEPGLWTLTTVWRSVGDYRRALGAYDVKLHAHPLMYLAVDEPTAFEVLVESAPGGAVVERSSDRAADADTIGLDDPKV